MDTLDVFSDSYGLPMRQRHLRNLRNILVRNICPRYAIRNLEDITKYSFFYTLHENCKSPAYYTSSKSIGTLNPVWEKINFPIAAEGRAISTELRSEFVCIRVWISGDCDDDYKDNVLIRWDVNFSGLIPLEKEHSIIGCNVILFEFDGGLYIAPFTDKVSIPPRTPEENVNIQNLRMSYRWNSLNRVQLSLNAINEVKQKSEKAKSAIAVIHNRRKELERRQIEAFDDTRSLHQMSTMRSEFESKFKELSDIQILCDSQRSLNEIDELALREKYDRLSSLWDDLFKNKKSYFEVRDQLIQTGGHLVKRRKQLLTDMASIYPITKDPVKEKFYIAGVHLPNSEELSGHDDTLLGVALGFTCHLVKLISVFLDVPLRYPIEYKGSRSSIRDDIIDVLSDKDRDFPLYAKGRERYQFEYAVYILNKNIVQLRHYCGMPTSGLGSTLSNLYTLLDDKLGVVKTTRSNAFATQHVHIPPNLAGPLDATTRTLPHTTLAIDIPSKSSAMLTAPASLLDSTSTASTPQIYSANISLLNSNNYASTGNIPHLTSSTNSTSNIGVTSKVNNSIDKLASTRSLTPSMESLASSQEGGSLFRRTLKAFKIFRTSSSTSVNSSPSLSTHNSKSYLIQASATECPQSEVLVSPVIIVDEEPAVCDDDDDQKNKDSLTVRHPNTSEQPTSDVACTDTTLNEVISRLDNIIRVSENQNDNLSLSAERSLVDDDDDDDDIQKVHNLEFDAKAPIINCNGTFNEDQLFKDGCTSSSDVVPFSSFKSSPLVFRSLMTNTIETPDECSTPEDELH